MGSLDRPKLRPLSGRQVEHDGTRFVALEDSLRVTDGPVLIPVDTFHQVVRHFDGSTSLDEIRAKVQAESSHLIQTGELEALIEQLDRAMVLDGPTFAGFAQRYAKEEVRPASLAGRSYPSDPMTLQASLSGYFAAPGGSGPPSEALKERPSSLRAILSPHIDFGRGGPVYSHAYRSLVEQSDADVFVILGVAHQYCRHRFALTRKDFQTPIGTAITDRDYVDRIARSAGHHLFDDELAHRTEHSIEFQVVFLQHVLGGRRDFQIVPILVGSFHDLMQSKLGPTGDIEVARMVGALQSAEVDSGKKVAYIGGIDLCHVGPDFGDPSPIDDLTLDQVRSFDASMLARATALDADEWFSTAARVENRWRVCGLAATYTLLKTIGPARGKLLSYDQAVDPARRCCVTFASVSYEAVSSAAD